MLKSTEKNLKKRLIKAPKIYLRDTGILHCLRDITTYDNLLANPMAGASWESFDMENILAATPYWRPSFMRTSNGAEIDLILERGTRILLFEFKLSKAPKPSRGFYELSNALKPEAAFVIAPVDTPSAIRPGVMVESPNGFLNNGLKPT